MLKDQMKAAFKACRDGRRVKTRASVAQEYRQLVQVFGDLFRASCDQKAEFAIDWLVRQPYLLAGIEQHGLAPLLWQQINQQQLETSLTEDLRQQLKIMAWHHDFAARQRQKAARELMEKLSALGAEPIVLKGFAFAHMLYARPALRPMADIDILIPKETATNALQVLDELGYAFEEVPRNRRHIHHHLAVAWRMQEGLRISIECHIDVFSADVIECLDYASVRSQRIVVNEWSFLTLGWEQQWLNLWRHQFEPALQPSLKGYMDMALLLQQHGQDMDWQWIASKSTLSVQFARRFARFAGIELPITMAEKSDEGVARMPDIGIPKLVELKAAPQDLWKPLFFPSRWWLRGRYEAHSHYGGLVQHHWALLQSLVLRLGKELQNPHYDY